MDTDIILRLNGHPVYSSSVIKIFGCLDYKSLLAVEEVSTSWRKIVTESNLWQFLVEKDATKNTPIWMGMIRWIETHEPDLSCTAIKDHSYFKSLYRKILFHTMELDTNWRSGACVIHEELASEGTFVTAFKFDNYRIFAGFGDGTIRVWNRWTFQCLQEYENHKEWFDEGETLYVVALDFNEDIMISVHNGCLEHTVKVWDIRTQQLLNTWSNWCGVDGDRPQTRQHAPLQYVQWNDKLCLGQHLLLTGVNWYNNCISIRKLGQSSVMEPRNDGVVLNLKGQCLFIELDDQFIVFGLGSQLWPDDQQQQCIEIRCASTYHVLRCIDLHSDSMLTDMQYRNGIISSVLVGGGTFLCSGNSFKLWDAATGASLCLIESNHFRLSFNSKFIVSVNATERALAMEGVREKYGNKIRNYKEMKIWDLEDSLKADASPLVTLPAYNWGRVVMDDFQVIILDYDGQLLVLDFLPIFPPTGRNTCITFHM